MPDPKSPQATTTYTVANPPETTGRRRRRKAIAWAAALATVVLGGLLIVFFTHPVDALSGAVFAKAAPTPSPSPPVNVTVEDHSVCNFVAPLSGASAGDPTKLKMGPGDVGQEAACEKALRSIHGAVNDLSLEAVLAPTGDAAVVLTDVTVHVRKRTLLGDSAFYSPAGTGGGGDTLSIGADVEKTPAVEEVDVYGDDGSTKTYKSMLAVRPRPTATRAKPLIVDIDLYGDKYYTTFDVDLHWQSSTASGFVRLDNGGVGYMVAGSDGLPDFRGAGDSNTWEAGSN